MLQSLLDDLIALVQVLYLACLAKKLFIPKTFRLLKETTRQNCLISLLHWKQYVAFAKGIAEDIAQAALSAGTPGPAVTFGEGGGIRVQDSTFTHDQRA